jgi:hypothetical protein
MYMSIEEELSESAGEAKAPFDKRVAASMAVIAAALAVVSVFGQVLANEELLAQQKSSDQWAFYQAKSIRRYESDIARDLFGAMAGAASAQAAEKYAGNMERYGKDAEEVQAEAKKLAEESVLKGRQALRMHFGEVFLEIGIVFGSLAILTRRSAFWYTSIASALGGAAIAITMLTIS